MHLLSVLETGSFPINVHHLPDPGLGPTKHSGASMVFALRCSIWANLDSLAQKHQAATLDDTLFQAPSLQVTDMTRLLVK